VWIFPVLLDSRPSFLPPDHGSSLLLAPLGAGTVLDRLRSTLSVVTQAPPVILAPFAVEPGYEQAIRAACPDVERVESVSSFAGRYRSYEASDSLLFADPEWFPLDPHDPALVELGADEDPRGVRHLVALEKGSDGTQELVETDSEGRVRGIRRYYDSVTWPLTSGVSCSLVPVACLLLCDGMPLTTLPELRRTLAARGVSSRDLPLQNGTLDLGLERGLLALNERLVLDLARERALGDEVPSPLHAGQGSQVHASARILGPVVIQDGAVVEAGATLVGPTVIGSGAHIGRDAVVAQSLIGSDGSVSAGTTVRHRVWLDGAPGKPPVRGGHPDSRVAGTEETLAAAPPCATHVDAAQPADGPGPAEPVELALEHPPGSLYAPVKRALDFVVALLGLLIVAPFGVLIAALIKLDSKGPVFFGHLREGLHGRPFRCWKFRTMTVGADARQRVLARQNEVDGPQFKVHHDPRYTGVGRLLSTSTLDELPQLFNVLVGQMSLVGPRPSPFRENQLCIPWREARLSVRPGVTGLWQVCRHDRHKGDFHQWIYYDLLYVRNLSFSLDLKLLVATPISLLRGRVLPLHWLLPRRAYHDRRAAVRSAGDTSPRVD
jgi:lipopolysaccharide/colanic/teichoic acid biosynthesis glycosyltransferase